MLNSCIMMEVGRATNRTMKVRGSTKSNLYQVIFISVVIDMRWYD